MKQNESLNNTCILFDPNNEAQQKAIIRFYNDNGYEGTPIHEWDSNDCIGIFQGYTGPELDYWDNDGTMKVIDLPKEYYPIVTPIVESEISNLPIRKVCFFTLKNGKYLTENGIEITTDMLTNYNHQITDTWSYIILD